MKSEWAIDKAERGFFFLVVCVFDSEKTGGKKQGGEGGNAQGITMRGDGGCVVLRVCVDRKVNVAGAG
jgi:hypothetical protein